MRVVLDTNILVAAIRSNRGASYKLLSLIPDTRFRVAISLPLYMEYLDVLGRSEHLSHKLTNKQKISAVRYLLSEAHLQEIYFQWRPFLTDADDDMVLELAVAAQAKYIVTFNLKDFRGVDTFGITAVSPKAFLQTIGEIP